MRISSSVTHLLCASATIIALLGGCGSDASLSSALGPAPGVRQSSAKSVWTEQGLAHMAALTNRRGLMPQIHLDRHRSWMRPDAKKQWLLYATDGDSGTVDIYNYRAKGGKLYGQITGFEFPYGDCVDGAGNVYVADLYAGSIYEYAHGGTIAIKTLDVTGFPIGCSVDPTTGNLAVSGFGSASTQPGAVWIFPNASGTPKMYEDPNIDSYWSPGYDNAGNLFVEGTTNFTTNYLDELPYGGSTFIELSLVGGTISTPGGVMWDGFYLAVGDQGYENTPTTAVYRVSVSGSAATVVRTTILTDNCYPSGENTDVVDPFIGGTTRAMNTVIGGNLWCTSRFAFWNYANGGNPKRVLPVDIAPVAAFGQTVSRGTSGS